MRIFDELKTRKTSIAVVGLGYVGMPLAVEFSKYFNVIGYDNNENKVKQYMEGIDPTEEIGAEGLKNCEIKFSADPKCLQEALFVVIAVPTPINGDKTPDLNPVKKATKTVGRNLKKGAIVVYESTVYPGVTEEICVPILEKESNFKCIDDFKVGYSPERINPGDKIHKLKNITKIVSGIDKESLDIISMVYDTILNNIYVAPSIKVAEAAKLVENSQRDVNIAFMNELAMVFHRMGIDTNEVVKAMGTKWNALGFKPGLVGGHCIGVDPYYFVYQAQNLGYNSQIIAAGRRINDGMSEFVVMETIKTLIKEKVDVNKANIYLMGMTFKENCPDTRNSRSVDVYNSFLKYGLNVKAVDPHVDWYAFKNEYGIKLHSYENINDADCLIFLVSHDEFKNIPISKLHNMYSKKTEKHFLIDVKSMFEKENVMSAGMIYWNL